jgi:hypothetical protein
MNWRHYFDADRDRLVAAGLPRCHVEALMTNHAERKYYERCVQLALQMLRRA